MIEKGLTWKEDTDGKYLAVKYQFPKMCKTFGIGYIDFLISMYVAKLFYDKLGIPESDEEFCLRHGNVPINFLEKKVKYNALNDYELSKV